MTCSGRLFLSVLAVLWSVPSLAQDTGEEDTASTSESVFAAPGGAILSVLADGSVEGGWQLPLPEPTLTLWQLPPNLAAGIATVPAGSLVVLHQEDGTYRARYIPTKHFLMPEPMYDSSRAQARQLKICQPALDAIAEETLQMADRVYKTLQSCGDQFDVDEAFISDLNSQLQSMETRALVADDRLKMARRNTAVAWGITGGVALGAVAATVVSVAN